VSFKPIYTISPALLSEGEQVAALRERILMAAVQVPWIPALQKDTRIRNAHSSTAIEGNPLTLEQVREIEEGREIPATGQRPRREVANYFAGLRFVEKNAKREKITHAEVWKLHRIMAGEVMDQGKAGEYRTIRVKVGDYIAPPVDRVKPMMSDLLEWWNAEAKKISPIMSAAIIHHQFEIIHPFADGNGRAGRMLSLWELYRRGFDDHHIFSIDEFYWEDRTRYYDELEKVRANDGELTSWLEYSAEGLRVTLERVWSRIQKLTARGGKAKLVLRPKQEQLLHLLREHKAMTPREIWDGVGLSKQGALDLLRPLIKAGLVRRIGTKKTGRYVLT
jgi:cell filamentation protein, protein adenylyltransferase